MQHKVWARLPAPPVGFARTMGLPPFQAHLLYNRGLRRPAEAEVFLKPDETLLNDPSLLPDMDAAVARLRIALQRGETVGVFGDFDTDGITGTALLARALGDLDAAVVTYLPDRVAEGHGLSERALLQLRESGVTLLLTVDCGATAVDEVRLASSLGIDTIVTDHHVLHGVLPEAVALIDAWRPESRYPYPHLTGVGMAFKLAQALYQDLGRTWPEDLLELVALGTVADVGPLTGENRYLVKEGIERLNATAHPGIRALMDSAGVKPGSLDTESLSFGLIPRLNVAGRLAHPRTSLELLTATNAETAEALAQQLSVKNSERQMLTERGVEEARSQLEEEIARSGVPLLIVVASESWALGILGLIAGRLAEQYHRPAVAISVGDEVSRASARSISEFDIENALTECRDLLLRFGGHPRAAGFTAETSSLTEVKHRLQATAEERLRGVELVPRIDIDCEVSPALLAGGTFDFIQTLAPFGEGNPAPVFLTRNARVLEARQVGSDSRHLKMRLWHSGAAWDAIAFRQGDRISEAEERIDLVYNVGLNDWGHTPRLELTVLDFRRGR